MFTMSKDRRKKWRWTLKSSNGRIVGASTQGFSSKDACRNNALKLAENLAGAIYRNIDGT